jgi:hypothetical protein
VIIAGQLLLSPETAAFPSGGGSYSDGLLRRQRSTPTNETERRTAGMSGSPADALEGGRHHRYSTDALFGRPLLRFAEVRLDFGVTVAHVPRKWFTDAGTGG